MADSQFPLNKPFHLIKPHHLALWTANREPLRALNISEPIELHKRLLTWFAYTLFCVR